MKKQLQLLAAGEELSPEDTSAIFSLLLDSESEITDAQIGAYLFSSAIRVPSSEELVAAAKQLRAQMRVFTRVSKGALLDTCGTGGSGFNAFNTSTAVALVCAAAGQLVAKHGNRAASSRSGSADVLERLGVKLVSDESEQQKQLQENNFMFLFAPEHHPAAKRVAILRKELGLRTIFNFLGPLVNPASAEYQLLGVSNLEALEPMAKALCALGIERALVVRARDGLDELSCGELSDVYEISDNQITHRVLDPKSYGIEHHSVSEIEVSSAEESAKAMRSVLLGKPSAYRELVLLNSGAALYVCEQVGSIEDGIAMAREILDSQKANKVLEGLSQ
ncbi:UNVERIFIED_CONTAM: hypothetical protein GTU68_035938 [Idotea baltica]|nr:hypothetical protein [Idotea baltica]